MDYISRIARRSTVLPQVEFTIARLSLGRRIELGQRVRELSGRAEFLAAGKSTFEQIEAGLMQRQIERIYLEWGLLSVQGLTIDGEDATPRSLIDRGPEDLTSEILTTIRAELQLSEEERKN